MGQAIWRKQMKPWTILIIVIGVPFVIQLWFPTEFWDSPFLKKDALLGGGFLLAACVAIYNLELRVAKLEQAKEHPDTDL